MLCFSNFRFVLKLYFQNLLENYLYMYSNISHMYVTRRMKGCNKNLNFALCMIF